MKKQKNCLPNERGSGLIFAVILLFVILAMVVTLSSITVLETKMNQKTKSSVGAFYNSEAGVEWALNRLAKGSGSIADVFSSEWVPTDHYAECPMGGCNVYFLDKEGTVITNDATDVNDIKAVRSVGASSSGDFTQRAIEAAVAGDSIDWDNPNEFHESQIGDESVPKSSTEQVGAYKLCSLYNEWHSGFSGCTTGRNGDGTWYIQANVFPSSPVGEAQCSMYCWN